jgi:hypothetical protein
VMKPEGDVIGDAQVWKKGVLLKDHADTAVFC